MDGAEKAWQNWVGGSGSTPTTEQIRDLYELGADAVDALAAATDIPETLAMFDRWLASHDREKQAEAVLHAANEVGSLLEVGPIDTRSRAICDAQDIMFRVAAEYRNGENP